MFSKFLRIHFSLSCLLLSMIGAINYIVDPLWYYQGNKITKVNMIYDEKLTKTNLYLTTQNHNYDCFIFGSSRTTLLSSNSLSKNKCFNYSFSGGLIEEFVKYAEFIKKKGANPKKIYLGIDHYNFDPKKKVKHNFVVNKPKSIYQYYLFSSDILNLSLRTILRDWNRSMFYDRKFQVKMFVHARKYKPQFSKVESKETCNLYRLKFYKKLRNIFPEAEFISYVPPISGWYLVNNSYSRGLMNCQLQGIHQASHFFDAMYDFSYSSSVTNNTENTYNGSHFYPEVNDRIAAILEGKQSDFGIRVDQMNLDEYQDFHGKRLKEFLEKQGKEELWRG